MSQFGGVSRERFIQLLTQAPFDPDRTEAPLIVASPRTAQGLLTTSVSIVVVPVSTSDAVGPFDLTIYRVVPTLGEWGKAKTITGVNFRDQLVLNDVSGGGGFYFQISAAVDGLVLVGLAEQA